jgi:hypothetical protein
MKWEKRCDYTSSKNKQFIIIYIILFQR